MPDFPHLFQPLTIGALTVRNRIAMTTHGTGLPPARYARYLYDRALGSAGLVGVSAGMDVYVYQPFPDRPLAAYQGHPDTPAVNPATPEGIKFYDERIIPVLKPAADAVRKAGSISFGQIFHTGGAGGLGAALGVSAVRDDSHRYIPHAMTETEIEQLLLVFGHAARRVKEAGLDGVELHGAHGYVISQFVSPYTNKRTDQYGGSLENRLRFFFRLIETIRQHVGPAFPIGLRLNADDLATGGLTVTDTQDIVRRIQAKVVYISISGGSYTGMKDGLKMSYVTSAYQEQGPNVRFAAAVKQVATVPVIVSGRIVDPAFAEQVLANGSTDMVGMARTLIAEPDWGRKAQAGQLAEIRRCDANNECHAIGHRLPVVTCTINPAAGREEEFDLHPAPRQKRVLVVGAGPAGMEAALAAARNGHTVTLCEQHDHLGGQLADLARDLNRRTFADHLHYQSRHIQTSGIDLRLNTTVDAALVATLAPDVVIIATGSTSLRPDLPGVNGPNVFTASQVLRGEARLGANVLVVGGLEDHLGPPTLAEFLADQGKHVELLAETLIPGEAIEEATLYVLTKRLLEKNVRLTPLTKLRSIEPGRVHLTHVYTQAATTREGIDSIVLAIGGQAEDSLHAQLYGMVPELYLIGDARAPRRIIHAIREGARIARLISLPT